MPDSYGHAKDFFDPSVENGSLNTKRNLIQNQNGSGSSPKSSDLIVFSETILNPYGHVALVSYANYEIEIIQQNPGPFSPSREKVKST